MPVRSLNSSILKWPEKDLIIKQAASWASKTGERDDNIISIKCFGSVLNDSWGVGSDLDILIEVRSSEKSFMIRSLDYDASEIDVPVEILVYTNHELLSLKEEGSRFYNEIEENAFILYPEISLPE